MEGRERRANCSQSRASFPCHCSSISLIWETHCWLEMNPCPFAHTATLGDSFASLCALTEGSLQTSQGSKGILSSPEHPPHTEVTQGDLTTYNTPCRLTVMKGHAHFEMPPKRPAELGYLDVGYRFRFLQLWTLKAALPLWPFCL